MNFRKRDGGRGAHRHCRADSNAPVLDQQVLNDNLLAGLLHRDRFLLGLLFHGAFFGRSPGLFEDPADVALAETEFVGHVRRVHVDALDHNGVAQQRLRVQVDGHFIHADGFFGFESLRVAQQEPAKGQMPLEEPETRILKFQRNAKRRRAGGVDRLHDDRSQVVIGGENEGRDQNQQNQQYAYEPFHVSLLWQIRQRPFRCRPHDPRVLCENAPGVPGLRRDPARQSFFQLFR